MICGTVRYQNIGRYHVTFFLPVVILSWCGLSILDGRAAPSLFDLSLLNSTTPLLLLQAIAAWGYYLGR